MTHAWDPLLEEVSGGTFVTDVESGRPCVRRVTLRVVQGPDRGRSFELDVGTRLVGTHQDADLRLSDPQVSRRHLEVAVVDDGVRVVDLGSKNGVFHGRTRIAHAVLPPGERVVLGGTTLLLEAALEPVEIGEGPERFGELTARSPGMRRVFALLSRASRSFATVLFEGETGVGKDVLARTLHQASTRQQKPFLVFDCAAVSPNVIASELFGHKKGAFTGAHDDRAGVFEAARGGTVFLDEIGELPLDLQPSLLRVLESRQVRRVGENQPRDIDVRIVAATNRGLPAEVEAGRFRQDLYYRLAIIRVPVPPLRERALDIEPLVEHFLKGHGLRLSALSRSDLARLLAHPWPGNVRELRNVIEQSVALSEGGALELFGLGDDDRAPPRRSPPLAEQTSLRSAVPDEPARRFSGAAQDDSLWSMPFKDARASALALFERMYVERLLEKTEGNVSRAASTAEIDRNYLYRLMRRHGVERTKE